MIPMPGLKTCAPQSRFSGLAAGPRPALVIDDDAVTAGALVNCWMDLFPLKLGNKSFLISGVTKDSTGAALGGCTVKLYTTVDDVERYDTVSDASGNFSFSVPSNGWAWYAVAYKAGSPDVAGTTKNTLVGT